MGWILSSKGLLVAEQVIGWGLVVWYVASNLGV